MLTNGAAMRQIANSRSDWYRITNKTDAPPEVFIYGEIGWDGVTADDLVRDLSAVDADRITVRVNSTGGSVFGGVAIYNSLRTHNAKIDVVVDSLAASIAAVIAQAGDTRTMVQHSRMMIHNAQGIGIGDADELEAYADLLRKENDNIADVYATRSGNPKATFKALMKAETWFTADEAVSMGLADEVLTPTVGEESTNSVDRDEIAAMQQDIAAVAANTSQDLQNAQDDEPDQDKPATDFSDLFDHKPFADLLS